MLEMEVIFKSERKKSIVLEKKNLENISLTSIQTVQEISRLQNINLETDLISLYIVQGDKKLMKKKKGAFAPFLSLHKILDTL